MEHLELHDAHVTAWREHLAAQAADDEFRQSALNGSRRIEAQHARVCWIDKRPEWESAAEWLDSLRVLVRPPNERKGFKVRLRLLVPGGSPRDEVAIVATYEPRNEPDDFLPPFWLHRLSLTLATFEGARVRHFTGDVDDIGTEMRRRYILGMPTPQAERVAQLVRDIGAEVSPVELHQGAERAALALMRAIQPRRAARGRCIFCARPLADPVSKARGIGPDCFASLSKGVRHA